MSQDDAYYIYDLMRLCFRCAEEELGRFKHTNTSVAFAE